MAVTLRPKQRIYLVDRAFQFRYIWAAIGMGFVSTGLTALVILYPLYTFEILRIPRFLPWPILGAMLLAVVINIVSIGMMGLIMTHRVAGPVFGMIRQLRRVGMGIFTGELRVRPGDELQPLVRNLNNMIESLAKLTTADLARVAEIRAALETGPQGCCDGALETARALERDLAKRLGNAIGDSP
jgi:hypothetical protein